MNLLVDELPNAVEIDGVEYAIETDFRVALRIMLAFEDDELTTLEKQSVLLQNLYQKIPTNGQAAVDQGMKFLNGGLDGIRTREYHPRLYSFGKDAALILSAFQQTHGVDLEDIQMHWWKFMALFLDLGSETAFCNLVGLRKRVKTGQASKEERQAARELGELFDVPEPDLRTPDERDQEAEFMRLVKGG